MNGKENGDIRNYILLCDIPFSVGRHVDAVNYLGCIDSDDDYRICKEQEKKKKSCLRKLLETTDERFVALLTNATIF